MMNKVYLVNAAGKSEKAARSDLDKKLDEANTRLSGAHLKPLGTPSQETFSIDTVVDQQRRFESQEGFGAAVMQADGKLRAYQITGYGIQQKYQVSPDQLKALNSVSTSEPRKKSSTAGLFEEETRGYLGIENYLKN